MQTLFSQSRQTRNSFCKEKDKVLHPILTQLKLHKDFTAILMPNLFGHEAYFLTDNNVPAQNLFAIEDNSVEQHTDSYDVHQEIKLCQHPDRKQLKGMRTTEKPESLSSALDEAYWTFDGKPFDLIYLDFLSQPDYENHYKNGILKILKSKMLKPTSTFIITFGRGRSHHDTAEFNKQLLQEAKNSGIKTNLSLPNEIYIYIYQQQLNSLSINCLIL